MLEYVVCPLCLGKLALNNYVEMDDEVREGVLKCLSCGTEYQIIGFLPILTPPGAKPYDWMTVEIGSRPTLREAFVELADGKIKPKMVKPGEPLLTEEEIRNGEREDNIEYWGSVWDSVKERQARELREREDVRVLASMVEPFIEYGGVGEACRVLDVGTGSGWMLEEILNRWNDKEIFALDIAYIQLKRSKAGLDTGVS